MYWFYALFSRGGRVLIVAITMLPLFYFMILSTPALAL
jgi:hypothetical protein